MFDVRRMFYTCTYTGLCLSDSDYIILLVTNEMFRFMFMLIFTGNGRRKKFRIVLVSVVWTLGNKMKSY